jgi:hypothetical protein
MNHRILLCTDLDRTLLPNGRQPESAAARAYFSRLAAHPSITLAYVTGRHRDLVLQAIDEYSLPFPDWVIGDVGSTIYRIDPEGWHYWQAWEEDIAADWKGRRAEELRPFFADLPSLWLQEDGKQNHFKLSYYLPLDADVIQVERQMGERLAEEGLTASLIHSVDEAASVGLLDVLPARANKLHAVDYLMSNNGFDLSSTVFAGDSGNDLSVLCSPIPAVLVGNAAEDVVKQAFDTAASQGTTNALYHAKGDFLAMNGNYSAGILEGLCHYHPETRLWMQGM